MKRGIVEHDDYEEHGGEFIDDETDDRARRKPKRRGPLFVLFMLCLLILLIPALILGFYLAAAGSPSTPSIAMRASRPPSTRGGPHRPCPSPRTLMPRSRSTSC